MFMSLEWRALARVTVGQKAVMALSGALLYGWVVLHMLGNLLVFGGAELLDGYGAALQGSPLLWLMRAVLLVALGLHVAGAIATSARGRAAVGGGRRAGRVSGFASRSMRLGGVALALYLVYHLLHIYGPLHAQFIPGAVHHNLVTGLSDPLAAGLYLAASLILGLHLAHGGTSWLCSLGVPAHGRRAQRAASVFAAAVTLGFAAPCVAALAGWL